MAVYACCFLPHPRSNLIPPWIQHLPLVPSCDFPFHNTTMPPFLAYSSFVAFNLVPWLPLPMASLPFLPMLLARGLKSRYLEASCIDAMGANIAGQPAPMRNRWSLSPWTARVAVFLRSFSR